MLTFLNNFVYCLLVLSNAKKAEVPALYRACFYWSVLLHNNLKISVAYNNTEFLFFLVSVNSLGFGYYCLALILGCGLFRVLELVGSLRCKLNMQAHFNLFLSCLFSFHWPNLVLWPSLASVLGSKMYFTYSRYCKVIWWRE